MGPAFLFLIKTIFSEMWCNAFLSPANLSVAPKTCDVNKQRLGTKCSVSCPSGFERMGAQGIHCAFANNTATWLPAQADETLPWCKGNNRDLKRSLVIIIMKPQQRILHLALPHATSPFYKIWYYTQHCGKSAILMIIILYRYRTTPNQMPREPGVLCRHSRRKLHHL